MVLGPLTVGSPDELLIQDPLFYDDNGIYCSTRHRFAKRKHVDWEDMLQEKWVLGPEVRPRPRGSMMCLWRTACPHRDSPGS